ncbi:hypothetical protein DIPPA_24127 [Diplonema papillatum]|nr:hypothetical protein DIPPA_24127 [Diplonema papillatum]
MSSLTVSKTLTQLGCRLTDGQRDELKRYSPAEPEEGPSLASVCKPLVELAVARLPFGTPPVRVALLGLAACLVPSLVTLLSSPGFEAPLWRAACLLNAAGFLIFSLSRAVSDAHASQSGTATAFWVFFTGSVDAFAAVLACVCLNAVLCVGDASALAVLAPFSAYFTLFSPAWERCWPRGAAAGLPGGAAGVALLALANVAAVFGGGSVLAPARWYVLGACCAYAVLRVAAAVWTVVQEATGTGDVLRALSQAAPMALLFVFAAAGAVFAAEGGPGLGNRGVGLSYLLTHGLAFAHVFGGVTLARLTHSRVSGGAALFFPAPAAVLNLLGIFRGSPLVGWGSFAAALLFTIFATNRLAVDVLETLNLEFLSLTDWQMNRLVNEEAPGRRRVRGDGSSIPQPKRGLVSAQAPIVLDSPVARRPVQPELVINELGAPGSHSFDAPSDDSPSADPEMSDITSLAAFGTPYGSTTKQDQHPSAAHEDPLLSSMADEILPAPQNQASEFSLEFSNWASKSARRRTAAALNLLGVFRGSPLVGWGSFAAALLFTIFATNRLAVDVLETLNLEAAALNLLGVFRGSPLVGWGSFAAALLFSILATNRLAVDVLETLNLEFLSLTDWQMNRLANEEAPGRRRVRGDGSSIPQPKRGLVSAQAPIVLDSPVARRPVQPELVINELGAPGSHSFDAPSDDSPSADPEMSDITSLAPYCSTKQDQNLSAAHEDPLLSSMADEILPAPQNHASKLPLEFSNWVSK